MEYKSNDLGYPRQPLLGCLKKNIFLYIQTDNNIWNQLLRLIYRSILFYDCYIHNEFDKQDCSITRQIWGIWKLRLAYSPETPNLGQNRWWFVLCDLEIWRMTMENNRASLLCCFKLCVTFHSHQWIQTGVTVRKRPIWVKLDDFESRVTLKFDGWPWKTIGHLFYATSGFVHHFVAIDVFKHELESENGQFGSNSTIFRAVWPWNLTDDLEKQ